MQACTRNDTAKTARFLKDEALRNDVLARFLQAREHAALGVPLALAAQIVLHAHLHMPLCSAERS